jgi:uncharacterized repeat protein (TIGR01451 family)
MRSRTNLKHTAMAVMLASLAGMMGACESTGTTSSTAPRGAGSGSPTFLHTPSGQAERPAPRAADPAPVVQRTAAPMRNNCDYSPNAGAGMGVSAMAFPTGDAASSALMLHTVMPAQVRRGAEFGYEYHVTNITGGTLQNVAVTLESQSNLDVLSATPAAMSGAAGNTWAIGDLGPCETQVIRVTAVANDTGSAGNCVSVSYNNSLCAVTQVVDPDLTIAKTATPRVLRCDPITLTYEVCNPGTGVASGVVVRDTLPSGLTVNGSRNVEIPVGDLAAGECRELTVTAMASGTGEFCSPASANSSEGLSANSGDPCTVVVAPELEIACNARDRQYINRNAEYEFTVSNTGNGVAANTVVNISLPAGAEYVSGSNGAMPTGNTVAFQVGSLRPGASETVSVTLKARTAGDFRVGATASGACAEPVSTQCETNFRGIPAILLEVVDLVDPVEVGNSTTYRITVTNQGSAADKNIVVACTMADEQEFVSATGATGNRVNGKTVTFNPVASLAPGAQASWDLVIRATGESDVRFAVEMNSDSFSRPIRETESTNQYE